MKGTVPSIRINNVNDKPLRPEKDFVLYWMIANRRTQWNFSLQRAVDWAKELNKPLFILEALRIGYPWACERFHRFILDGMADNRNALKRRSVFYFPYLELEPDADKGLLLALAKRACIVVTDDFPAFFLPRMVISASRKIPVLLEQVDSNGLLPMRSADRVFPTAYAFRRFLQKALPQHLTEMPKADPLKGAHLPGPEAGIEDILKKWPPAPSQYLTNRSTGLGSLPIDHGVSVVHKPGGSMEAQQILKRFMKDRISLYMEKRNQPEAKGTSGLSPYLHFGHISCHQVFHEIMARENWFFDRLSGKTTGNRNGWWGMSESAEAFLDELVTWREVGFNMCWQRNDYDRYGSLPDWARSTLKAHEMDERKFIYSLKDFERGATHDPLWNAAQIQLVREGRIHNYLRMLWGKKILEWTATPRKALEIMIQLNNKYALDGRDPNSYSGIFWVLGRYDRAWGPERPIYGKIRYMSSKNTARKVHVRHYVEEYSPYQ